MRTSQTTKINSPSTSSLILLEGEGTALSDIKALQGRAKRKLITQKMMLNLIDLSKSKEDYQRQKSYWNSFHCQNKMVSSQGRIYGKYCKNRFCTVCSAIRKADIINRYYPTLKTWKEPHFLTLTVKAVKINSLSKWINGMFRAFSLILNKYKKRYQRGKAIPLVGIKSLECNFNPQRKTYNPHFHIITANKEIAEILKQEWLQIWKYKDHPEKIVVSPKAQFIRKVENLERDLIEVIKYGSKIFTEPDIKRKSKKEKNSLAPMIYIQALDSIFRAMKGKRIFERFGFNLPKQERPQSSSKLVFDFENWNFNLNVNDWVNPETGECLTGYQTPVELSYLLEEGVNTTIK
ncbi:hypothetical protein ETU09_07945 [Apibacter muscae]|uniref:Uncharacterized protein n=1 Tax=Apibacter muscae TaxID=2509004 RepID=A0A563DAX7_9FLAO|nr:protein rep [Apibacter muscae]TWP27366.1 hypothetical protein ETU09_07945 [Apibacter muscae]